MASSLYFPALLSLIFLFSPSSAQTSFLPKALIIPVTKDASTLQYITQIRQRTPLITVPLTLDLGGQFLWVNCDDYVSSSFTTVHCGSPLCKLHRSSSCSTCVSPRPRGCVDTCGFSPDNPITRSTTFGDLRQDIVSVQSTDGTNPGRNVTVTNFLFTCGITALLEGLAKGVQGMAGLGRSKLGIPSRFAEAFSFRRKFAICLPSSTSTQGIVFFGNSSYKFLMNTDASQSLIYTPLIVNPVSTASSFAKGTPSDEYFIGVKSIRVNGKFVKLNTTLLSIDKEGNGGTKISTVNPYTVLESSIYKAVTRAFVNELSAIPRIAPVKPFTVCYNASAIGSTRVGPSVPQIDLMLQSNNVYWRIFGANSMLLVGENVLCLGFVDGGLNPRTSIVIGGYQLEDNLLEFDLKSSKLGFSSSLLFRQTTCSNFNFTSSV